MYSSRTRAHSSFEPNNEPSDNSVLGCLKRNVHYIKKFQYAFIFIACTAVLFFQVAKCIEKYVNKSTGKTINQPAIFLSA